MRAKDALFPKWFILKIEFASTGHSLEWLGLDGMWVNGPHISFIDPPRHTLNYFIRSKMNVCTP